MMPPFPTPPASTPLPLSNLPPPPTPDPHSPSRSNSDQDVTDHSDATSTTSITTASSTDAPPLIMPANPSTAPLALRPRIPHAPRRYQLDLLNRAKRGNVIACLHTGAGKTLIAALLINSFFKDPTDPAEDTLHPETTQPHSPSITADRPQQQPRAVFLVPRVPLVSQQATALRDVLPRATRIATYVGARVDTWDATRWKKRLQDKDVLVATPQILLNLLRHGLISLSMLSVLVVDEAHHATKKHPYTCIFREFYHTIEDLAQRPRVFAMTATPVKTKTDASGSLACDAAITALEHTLDAWLVAVSEDDRAELEAVVPRPDEFVVFFEGLQPYRLQPTNLISHQSNQTQQAPPSQPGDRIAALTSQPDVEPEFIADQEKNHLLSDLMTSVNTSTQTVLPSDTALPTEHDLNVLRALHLRLGFVPALLFSTQLCNHRKLPLPPTQRWLLGCSTPGDDANGGLRDKTSKLLDLLFSEYARAHPSSFSENVNGPRECRESKTYTDGERAIPNEPPAEDAFRAIVFVQERATALALAATISTAFHKCPHNRLRAQAMLGCSSSEARVTQAEQRRVVAAFRAGLFGILVSTSVGEEGLDIPACRLVVSFDAPASPTTYVQARGRARRRDARFVALLAHNLGYDFQALRDARHGAAVMAAAVSPGARASSPQSPPIPLPVDNDNDPLLRSRSTSARVRAPESVGLLYQAVAYWSESDSAPQYKVQKSEKGFTAEVSLPARFGDVVGRCDIPQLSEAAAKRRAALDAYGQLYDAGWVDDHLLPKRRKRMRNRQIIILGERSEGRSHKSRAPEPIPKSAKKHTRVRACEIEHPLMLVEGKNGDKSGEGRDSRASGQSDGISKVGEVKKPPDTSTNECSGENSSRNLAIAEHLTCESAQQTQMHIYVVQVDRDLSNMPWAAREHPPLGLALRKQLHEEDLVSVQCPAGEPLLTLIASGSVWWTNDQERQAGLYARAVQLCHLGKTIGTAVSDKVFNEDFSAMHRLGFYLVPLVRLSATLFSYNIDWFSVEKFLTFGWFCGPLEPEDRLSPHNMVHRHVCSSHERMERTYMSLRIEREIFAYSPPRGSLRKFQSYRNYFETRFHSRIHPDQAMMSVQSVRNAMMKLTESDYKLPPQIVRVIPIPPIACYILCLLPEWQTFMAFRSCWRRNRVVDDPSTFLLFTRALQPNVISTVKGKRKLNYERLEFLGDAVLKVVYSMLTYLESPEEGEGVLSDTRDLVVSNQVLASLAMNMRIQDCVAFSGISKQMKKWPWHWSTQKQKGIGLSEKVLADCVEALIGVQYEQGGISQATVFMKRHKLLEDSGQTLDVKSIAWLTNPGSLEIASPALGDDPRLMSDNIAKVERIIGYSFSDKRHLVTALTHGSAGCGQHTYQRYEYLGDAIIGFLILSHFYYEYPHLTPGDLTFLRGPALSNDLFARGIVKNGIHRMFWFDSDVLKTEIERFEKLLASEKEEEGDVCKRTAVPKVLGDLLESIIGAMVVDKGMQLEGVLEMSLRLIGGELDRFANPERFVRDPVAELHEFLQKQKVGDQKLEFAASSRGDRETRCAISAGGSLIGAGSGSNRRVARRVASLDALDRIREGSLSQFVGRGGVAEVCRALRLGSSQ